MRHKEYKVAPMIIDAIDDPYRRIAAEIIIAAIEDWRKLIDRHAWVNDKYCNTSAYMSFAAIRRFFNSDWCAFLMMYFNIEPERILEQLEKELHEAMANDQTAKRKKRKRYNK